MSSPTHNRVTRLLKNASWLLGANTLASLIGFAQAIVLGRELGAAGYGLLGIAIVFTTVVNQLFDVRLWETVTKFVGEYHSRGQDGHGRAMIRLAFLVDFVTGALAFLLVLLVARPVSERLLHRPDAAVLIQLYAATLLVATVNQTAMAVLRVFDRFRWLGTERVTFHAVRFVALWIVAATSGSLVHILLTYLATDFLRAVVLILLARHTRSVELAAPGPDHLGLLRPRLREFLNFTAHSAVTMFLSLVSRQLDVLILAAFRGDAEVGIYRMARNFAQLLLRVVDPVYQAIFPELIRLQEESGGRGDLTGFIKLTMRRVMVIIVPVIVVIEATAPWLLRLTVGPEFLPAAPAIRIMAIGVLVHAALLWARPLALTRGRPEISTAAFAGGAVVLVVSSLLMVPRFGVMGSAVAFLLTMSTVALLSAIGAARSGPPAQTVER